MSIQQDETIDVIVLAGGLGTRLAKVVPHLPKVVAPIGSRPFISLLLDRLSLIPNLGSVVFALGHRAEQVEETLKKCSSHFPIECRVEEKPLGTGGALLFALEKTSSSTLLILNGDSLFCFDWAPFFQFHHTHSGMWTLACRHLEDTSRFGLLEMGEGGRLERFLEKQPSLGAGWVNGGVYLMERELLEGRRVEPLSLEYDLFPQFLEKGAFGYPSDGLFIDIGTEASYREAQTLLGGGL